MRISSYHQVMEYSNGIVLIRALLSLSGALVRAIRPKQWTKNLIIYLALFFTVNEIWDPYDHGEVISLLIRTTLAFVLFSALSGGVYMVNDLFDMERDLQHPKKRLRPIASGHLPVSLARFVSITLMVGSLVCAFMLEPMFGGVCLAYGIIMVIYTVVMKQVVILDVFVISAGFVLRAVAGAVVLEAPISTWLYVCTGLGALFIALSKRRSELVAAGENAGIQRDTLEWYSSSMLDRLILVVAIFVVLAYSLYAFTAPNLPDNYTMTLTIPFVVYGLFRYAYLVHTKDLGETPEDILITDVPLAISILMWLATVATVLMVFRGEISL